MDRSVISSNILSKHMEVTVFLGVFSASLLSLWAVQKRRDGSNKQYPPGPRGVPVLGILPFLGDAAYLTFTDMAAKFGAVFQVYMGSRRTVVVNGVEAARQVLVVQSEDFAGRPDFESFQYISDGFSMAFGQYGDRVKLHKKVARSAIRQFSLNPSSPIEELIWKEGKLLIQDLLQGNGQPTSVAYPIHVAVGSVIYELCFGPHSKPCREDADFLEFLNQTEQFTDLQKAGGNPADLMPWLSRFFQHKVNAFKEQTTNFKKILTARKEEHFATYNPNKLRDITDALIKARNEYPPEVMEAAGLTEQHIMNTNSEVIGAGQNTVTSTLTWIVLYMVVFPEIQAKVHTEIDEVLGDELPQPMDRKRMPFVEACLLESWRFSAQIPFLLPHCTTRDTTLNGFDIPRDTLIFVNMWSVGRDPKVWKNPNTFDPTRFLDEDGFVDKCKAEDIFAFGGGKRRCLGELIARQESFIFFTMLFQKLSFEKTDGESYDLKGKFGLSLDAQDYKYIVKERVSAH